MNVDWDDLKAVLHVVRKGTLAAAATELGVNYTTVARRIARAERALGTVLFDRLADGYRPVEAALVVARHASEMETQSLAVIRGIAGRDGRLSGKLTVTAPQLLVGPHLTEVIRTFSQTHPEVDLHLRASNNLADLSRREADLAIRISRTPGDALKGLRLTEQHSASFASPDWAEQIKNTPERTIDWVVYDALGTPPKGLDPRFQNNRVVMTCDDMTAMVGAAQAGLGVVRMPVFLGRATPGLVQVPVLPAQPYAEIWVVAHADVWASAKVAAFREVLVPYFKRNRAVFTS